MGSVTQDMVQCESCKHDGPQSDMRIKGHKLDGSIRYTHRVGHGCRATVVASSETTALDVRSQDFDQEFYDPTRGAYNLTALWRARGRPANREPWQWTNTEEGQAWKSLVRDKGLSAPGPTGGLWFDDIQAALQYAAYLDPALKEDIYDRYVRSKMVSSATVLALPTREAQQINETHGIALWLKQKLETVEEIHHHHDYPGGVYLARFAVEEFTDPARMLGQYIPQAGDMLARGYIPVCIGKFSGQSPEKRIKQHHGKLPLGAISVCECWFKCDNPDTAEAHMRSTAPNYPIAVKITSGSYKDWFWLLRDALPSIREVWPRRMLVADLVAQSIRWRFDVRTVYVQVELL